MNPEEVAAQVRENCAISSAKNWGGYSVCGLLLRLRELYRWEKKLKPWEAIDHAALLEWIDGQEKMWERLANKDFVAIEIDGVEYDPFSVEEINRVLEGSGYVYGAGYIGALKPSFFFAELEKTYEEEGFTICILGRELARDLVSHPAMLQGRKILARRQPLGYFLWEKLFEAKATPAKSLLRSAFEDYGYDFSARPENQRGVMETVIREELDTYLHHEIGEALDEVFPEKEWKKLVTRFPRSKIELLARGIKDLLADTGEKGMLSYIISRRKLGSLGFYASLLHGFRKLLLPDMAQVYRGVKGEMDWGIAEEARREAYEKARTHAATLLEIYAGKKDLQGVEDEITRRLLRPLNL